MISINVIKQILQRRTFGWYLLFAGFAVVALAYWPGLSGGFVFDDYPNIVDNKGVQPPDATLASLISAALSSPSSDFKRPLASLTFALNFLATGLDPYWMKLTNLVIHLLNGLLVFLLTRSLIGLAKPDVSKGRAHINLVAAAIATGWMLLPINLTCVLYVVQRMESLANLFVLLGLLGYARGRYLMLAEICDDTAASSTIGWKGFWLCAISITIPSAIGLLAKETAAMLPLYAVTIEWALLGFRNSRLTVSTENQPHHIASDQRRDWRLVGLFMLTLALPLLMGLAWLLPGLFRPENWATRNFTLSTRLLSEARVVVDYILWTLLPTPSALSFYHDDFVVSQGLLTPWTTFACIAVLACFIALMTWLRPRHPLAALGIALFLGCQLLTATVLPLELVYEHRNYFASFGLLLAVMPWLIPSLQTHASGRPSFALARSTLLVGLLLLWGSQTTITAFAWDSPLNLAEAMAARAPESPRAQYELGRTYIIYSHYDPASPFTAMAYAPLEQAAALPDSSILPEQALIFMNSRMHLPLKDAWWDSMTKKLKSRKSTVQDESSLGALTQCARDNDCDLPVNRMVEAYLAALSHPDPSARLLAMYGDYAWNVLHDHELGLRMTLSAVAAAPNEPAYRITQIRMLVACNHINEAHLALKQLKTLNIGGHLDSNLAGLERLPGMY